MLDYEVFRLGNVELQSGEVLLDGQLAFKSYGELNARKDNVVVLPTFMTGTHRRNEGFFGPGRALDPSTHFIVSMNMFGNGVSSSPTNAHPQQAGSKFPKITIFDNVRCQHRVLVERFGINELALVAGWSMAGCQAYEWAAQYPQMVKAILPFCASAKVSPHNFVFLEGIKAALLADSAWNGGDYQAPPERGLKAFARVYAGWAYSQEFYRDGHFKTLGYASIEDLLVDWENDHVENWDANNLLTKIWTWQHSDISANATYSGDFAKALRAIEARAIVIPCRKDLYFPPEDNQLEVQQMANAELCVYDSPFGHCVASPGNDKKFERFLDGKIAESMA
ncbi:alpha/beta fold hydrolase [Hyphomicrobium sp. 99]|uniref:alpha/beta fold hydrolase n=1 Tax=Hyphomicrobium sp. 99 TaxID=1163419 RepID=UPI0018CD361D